MLWLTNEATAINTLAYCRFPSPTADASHLPLGASFFLQFSNPLRTSIMSPNTHPVAFSLSLFTLLLCRHNSEEKREKEPTMISTYATALLVVHKT
ncbi:hypothetical protein VNO77_23976 [Canavalia gladiata]|uniref:Uncharacterized protein n=1 Tax=Canavalia gladiata TaxID=3824 RepID=A0AAN9QC16_CANGL